VLFPSLSKAQTSNERLAAGYVKTAKYLAILLFPALGGLAAVAAPAVAVLWGERWLPVIFPLQILCLRSAIQSVIHPVNSLFLCRDRPDIPFKFGLCTLAFTVGAVAGLGYAFGLVGVAFGMLLSTTPGLCLLWLGARITETSLGNLLRAMIAPGVSAATSSFLAFGAVRLTAVSGGPDVVALGLGVLTGVVAYLATIRVCFADTARDVAQTFRVVFGSRPQQAAAARALQREEQLVT
jgi:O-antigen/teichoic acid export membrane protein